MWVRFLELQEMKKKMDLVWDNLLKESPGKEEGESFQWLERFLTSERQEGQVQETFAVLDPHLDDIKKKKGAKDEPA